MLTEGRRVLVVAYYFPPMGLSGVQRTLKFVKYLPEFGWKPTVLTVEPAGYPASDVSLLQEIEGRDIDIVRTRPAGPGRLFGRKGEVKLPSERRRKLMSRISDTFFIPDNKIGWKRRAVAKALELHRQEQFDLIFATAPPFTDFLIGTEIKKVTGTPLVLDYRDPWIDYPFKFYPTPLHRWYTRKLERMALRSSSFVITTNRRVKELILEKYPFLTYHDVDIISQGFDLEDIEEVRRNGSESVEDSRKKGVMRISYAGVFWEDRRPDHFLRALRELFDAEPGLEGKIEAYFIGTFRDQNLKLVEQLGLTNSVKVFGYLPHRECLRHLLSSDLLWVIVGDQVGSPGKTYEYIGTGKAILGLAPEGFLKQTILEAGGTVVPPGNVPDIRNAIRELYRKFADGKLEGATPEVINKYERKRLTERLVRIFESLLMV